MGEDRPLLSVTRLTFLTERNVFRSIASHSWTGKLSFSTHGNGEMPKNLSLRMSSMVIFVRGNQVQDAQHSNQDRA